MLRFKKKSSLRGINIRAQTDIPKGAKGIRLSDWGEIVIAILEPLEYRGIIVECPPEELEELVEEDPREQVILRPHKRIGIELFGYELQKAISEILGIWRN